MPKARPNLANDVSGGVDREGGLKFRIAEAALDLFLASGFDNVTVDAVAAASNVSRRTVFRHFSTKDEIPFPDHGERQALQRAYLRAAGPGLDPLNVLAESSKLILADFLSHRHLVLKRHQLTRSEARVRERELIENDRYTRNARRFLQRYPGTGPLGVTDIVVSMFDAAHRSALTNWVHSSGTTDAALELETNLSWILQILGRDRFTQDRFASVERTQGDIVLAVLPANSETYAFLDNLRRKL